MSLTLQQILGILRIDPNAILAAIEAGGGGIPVGSNAVAYDPTTHLVTQPTDYLVANVVPRTNTLAALLTTVGVAGELASATDVPAVIQFTGGVTAGGPVTYSFESTNAITVLGTGAITGTLPITSDFVRLTIGTGVTSYTATFPNGYVDGQKLTVELISSQTGMNAYTLNGLQIAANTNFNLISSSVSVTSTTRPPVSATFRWNATATAWELISAGNVVGLTSTTLQTFNLGLYNIQTGAQSSAVGVSNQTLGAQSTAIGVGNIVGSAEGIAIGYAVRAYGGSAAIGTSTYAVGQYSVGMGSGQAIGQSSFAAGGTSGFGAVTGNPTSYALTVVSGGPTYTGTCASTAGLEASAAIVLVNLVNGVYTVGFGGVVSVTSGTQFTFTSAGLVPATGTSVFNVTDGQFAMSLGTSRARNYGAFSYGATYYNSVGDLQSEKICLATQTADATPTILTADALAANANLTFGNSNRFVLETDKVYDCTLSLVGKQVGSNNSIRFKRTFLAVNSGGTVTLSALSALGTDVGIGTSQWTTTWIASPPFTAAANATQKSIDITVTGLASTTITWFAQIDTGEARDA